MTTMTRTQESSAVVLPAVCLLMAFELGARTWKVGFTPGAGQRPRVRTVPAGDLERVRAEIAQAKRRFGMAADTPVVSCYEAGRDGFWLHRWLTAQGHTNYVVDSSSIEVPRRARRAKTDRLDLLGLLALLARYVGGERRAWRVVRVPSEAEEDARQLHRSWEAVQQDRTRLINRLQGLLASVGVRLAIGADFAAQVAAARQWDGQALPAGMQARLRRGWEQLQFLTTQRAELATARAALVPDRGTATGRAAAQLLALTAIGPVGGWLLATEIFGWRAIRNGRELGALVGLVPAPFQSGAVAHDQGITRAGNAHVRRVLVQLAWSWLRYQPTSALSQWYARRFGGGGKRLRRIGIVALARKLVIALWRYVETGTVPAGATLKPVVG